MVIIMSLRASRKVLCIIFSIIVSIGGLMVAGSVAIRCTLGSQSFVDKVLSNGSIKKECDENFKNRLEVIADKSDIPVHVFEASFDMEQAYSESLAKRIFTQGDTSMFSQDEVDMFENLCIEYLKGNSIVYNKAQVHNTALEAAQAYADSYGMYNTQGISQFILKINEEYSKFLSTGLIMMAIGGVVTHMLFSKAREKTKHTAYNFTTASFSIILTGLAGIIFRVGSHINIFPQIYSRAIFYCVSSAFAVMTAIGVLLLAVSGWVTYRCFREEDKEIRM